MNEFGWNPRRRLAQRRQALRRGARRAAKLWRLLPHPVFRRGLRFGVGAAIEHRTALAALRLRTVVDVGANVGQFSLLARALNPGARIVAFEPLPTAAATYGRVFADDGHATLVQVAVAPQRGTAAMHLSAAPASPSPL
ncbi:MAG: FkbM family methyltransferase, partial [Gammaproteobacteria bacterium]|nr:FkbM family methyltransferase [Gammaproteobacteria bacterium]